jgi:hypothetical protein
VLHYCRPAACRIREYGNTAYIPIPKPAIPEDDAATVTKICLISQLYRYTATQHPDQSPNRRTVNTYRSSSSRRQLMSSSFEKSVKGGTKVKLAPPKSKYVEHILLATQSGEAGVAEVFRTLTHRLRDSTWTVAFKSLIIVHLMIKEGAPDVTLSYLSAAPTHRLAINSFTDVQTQGHNIRRYSEYLLARAQAFEAAKCDFVAHGQEHVKRLSVDKGLLRETEIIQVQVRSLVKCNMLDNDLENEISLTAFRLLTRDLLDLYAAENEAVMNVLGHYFEMSRTDAERAIKIYKTFCKQTDQVVQFLGVARQFEHATRLEIPKIKHAPTSLAASLQEYLDDKEFDVNRRQYLAEQDAKKSGKAHQLSPHLQPRPKDRLPTSSTSSTVSNRNSSPWRLQYSNTNSHSLRGMLLRNNQALEHLSLASRQDSNSQCKGCSSNPQADSWVATCPLILSDNLKHPRTVSWAMNSQQTPSDSRSSRQSSPSHRNYNPCR